MIAFGDCSHLYSSVACIYGICRFKNSFCITDHRQFVHRNSYLSVWTLTSLIAVRATPVGIVFDDYVSINRGWANNSFIQLNPTQHKPILAQGLGVPCFPDTDLEHAVIFQGDGQGIISCKLLSLPLRTTAVALLYLLSWLNSCSRDRIPTPPFSVEMQTVCNVSSRLVVL